VAPRLTPSGARGGRRGRGTRFYVVLEPRELQNFWNVHLEGLAEASLSLGWQITADIGFRIYAKRFAEGTLSFAFRISRLRFKHEPCNGDTADIEIYNAGRCLPEVVAVRVQWLLLHTS